MNLKKTENDKPYMKYDRVGILFWFLFNNFQRTLIYGGIFLLMVTSPLWVFSVCPALITGIQTYTSKIFSPKIKENKTDATLPDQETSKVSNPLPIKKTKKVKVHLHRAQDYEDTPDNGHPEYVKHEEYAKLLIDYETKIELLEKLQADNEKLKEELSYKQDDIKSIITHIDPNAIYIGIDRFELGKRFRHMKKIYTINEINFEYKFVIVQATGEEEKKILL